MRTLFQWSQKAGKSLDEVKHDLDLEHAASSKKETNFASDEAKNKSSALMSMAPTSDSGLAGIEPEDLLGDILVPEIDRLDSLSNFSWDEGLPELADAAQLGTKLCNNVGNGAPTNAATQQNAKMPTCDAAGLQLNAKTPTRVSNPSQTQNQVGTKLMKTLIKVKCKASSSSSAVDNLKKKGKHTLTNSKNLLKILSGFTSNHSDAVFCLIAPGHQLTKPCDHVASKVHGKMIKFKYGQVYSCQFAENVHHECTRAYCKDCFVQFIQGPTDQSASSKKRRARGLSTTAANCCEHIKSSSYKPSNKVYVTKSRYNNGTNPLSTHCTGCGGEFV